jgi:hypothetical protein
LITVTVTDSLGATSAQSSAVTVTVNASPTVSIAPVGPLTLDVGQVQAFTATHSGGSGVIHYQWYLDGSAVGTDSSGYSYTAGGTSHSVTCTVTDSASTPVTSASNAVSVTVNSALGAPTVSASAGTIDQGQTTSLASSSVTTGTSPYMYQWLEWAPGGSYAAVGSDSASFSFVTSGATATGRWSFILQVTDNAGAAVNSAAVSVTVNPTISASAGAGGSISPTGNVGVNYGDSQTFTITANTGYYIVDVKVNGSSVGAVSSYTFTNVQTAYTISATFAQTPTPSPSPTATPTPTSSPASTPTPLPTATPTPTTSPSPTPTPTTSPNHTQSQSLPIEAIYGIMAAVVIVVIAAIVLVLMRSRKGKS